MEKFQAKMEENKETDDQIKSIQKELKTNEHETTKKITKIESLNKEHMDIWAEIKQAIMKKTEFEKDNTILEEEIWKLKNDIKEFEVNLPKEEKKLT